MRRIVCVCSFNFRNESRKWISVSAAAAAAAAVSASAPPKERKKERRPEEKVQVISPECLTPQMNFSLKRWQRLGCGCASKRRERKTIRRNSVKHSNRKTRTSLYTPFAARCKMGKQISRRVADDEQKVLPFAFGLNKDKIYFIKWQWFCMAKRPRLPAPMCYNWT